VVYSISCRDCEKKYIGETSQNLKKRIKQHMYDVDSNKTNTGLANHVLNEKHKINFENVEIIDTQTNTSKRRTLEAIHIAKNNSMNFKEDSYEINKFYKHIIDCHL